MRLALHKELCILEPARGIALFLGLFGMLNLLGGLFQPQFDCNIWWIDMRPAGLWLSRAFLAAASILLMGFAVMPTMAVLRKQLTTFTRQLSTLQDAAKILPNSSVNLDDHGVLTLA